jgi:DegV family protein with EDD domain
VREVASAVRIVTDSAADLDAETVERLRISVVPMTVHFGREVYAHSELSNDDFWRKAESGPHPSTSQPAIGLFEEVFSSLIDAGHEVLCVTITGRHSGTLSTALTVARRLGDRVKVVDSLSLSLGQGFQVLAAAHAALQGASLEQAARAAKEVRERSHLLILLNTIEHVQRGGRADGLIPILSRVTEVLNVKPILSVADGYLKLHKLVRTYKRGLQWIRHEVAGLGPIERLAVMHTRCAEVAQRMADALAVELGFPSKEILLAETGPALAVHGGPNVIGVAAVQRA